MRLQVNFDLMVDVRHVGKLALLGTAETWNTKDGLNTTVTFLLAISGKAPLAVYLNPRFSISPYSEVVYAMLIEEGAKMLQSPTDQNERFLIFNRTVDGKLHSPRRYLGATARKLRVELQQIEDQQLWEDEIQDEFNWADRNIDRGRNDPMPNFKRPRHV